MKKPVFIFLIMTAALVSVFADDGGSYHPEDWTYGNIYVKEPNDKIALENEILYFNNDNALAVFAFRNTVPQPVKVPCAFPVVIETKFKIENGMACPNYSWNSRPDRHLWSIALNKPLSETEDKLWEQTIPLSDIAARDKKLRVSTYSEYLVELETYGIPTASLYDSGSLYGENGTLTCCRSAYESCSIFLDGKPVPVLNVGIETTVQINPRSEIKTDDDRDNGEYSYLTIVLHFYHELDFKPSKPAKVEISYAVASTKRSYHGSAYESYYDISTGGTWKGAIRKLLVMTDMNMKVINGSTKPKTFTDILHFHVFENYKPVRGEYFMFSGASYGDDAGYRPVFKDDFEKQDFVTGISASSYLKGTYRYYEMENNWYPEEKKVKVSDYAPETSFDADLYNGWVEGKKGDGIGEWIGFTLTKNAFGPFAVNGLTRFPFYSDNQTNRFDADSPFSGTDRTSAWKENNRIQSMLLKTAAGTVKAKIELEDVYSGFNVYDGSIWQLNAVKNPCLLEKGAYRLEIADVFKGSKYDDTVLGEVWFIPLSDELFTLIREDEKSALPIFRAPIQNAFTERTVDHYSFKERKERMQKYLWE